MKKNHHLHRQIHLCLIILLLLFCSSSQVFAAARVNVKNTRIKLSATKLTYNKKVQCPKVRVTYKGKVLKEKKNYIIKYSKGCKKVGTYTVQIIGKGTYTGTVKKQFVILPPKAQIMNIYTKTATATVVVKRQTSQTSGYQLRYATNSKLKNAKTITVKGKKNNTIILNGLRAGTTYYLQTRTYMTVKGKKYYSKWSSTGHCTTNKKTNSTHQSATPTPTPTPVNPNPVVRGAYDTPHMRGIRSAVVGNINAWRTLADDMYRPRVLQQGEPTGIWARIGGGKYSYSGSGIDTATDYTRIQGGYDAKISRGWTVGGQVSYLRGSEDYVFDGSGKVKSFSVGAYGLKDLGKDQYVHVETQVGRVSNDFTARNEIGEAMSGDAKSNAYSIGVRYGKTLKYANGFYVEPQAQLNFTHFGGRNFNVGNVSVNQSGVNSTSGKLGLELGKQFGHGNLYTRFAAGHAFTGNVKTAFASGTAVKLTEQDLKGTWTEIAFGGRYGFNSNNSVFADVATGLSGDYQADWGVNAGFTHKF